MEYKFNNFYELIVFQAKKRSKKIALFSDQEKITYGDMLQKVDSLAGFFVEQGIKKGDKIALFVRNSPEFIYTIFAASKIGAVLVPINTFLKEDELTYILEDSGSSVLVASGIYSKVVNGSRADTLCKLILWKGEESPQSEENHYFKDALKSDVVAEHTQAALEDTAVII